jgi:hypothetical protein
MRETNARNPLSTAGKRTVAALVVAAGGFVLQMVSGVTNTPTIPPGLVALLVGGVVVAFAPWSWAPIVGAAAALFNLAAFPLVGAVPRLFQPSPLGGFIGVWLMFLSLIVAVVAGIVATIQSSRARR